MRLAIVGAGRTGRGFLARLFHEQARIVFFDRDEELIARLKSAGAYTVRYFDGGETVISNYEAHTLDEGGLLASCDGALVSVRGENAGAAGAWLTRFLPEGAPVIACENAADPGALLPPSLRAASGAVFCTTVADGPLDIRSERYPALLAGACGALETLQNLQVVPDFACLMKRKIYTYNAASGMIAYLGWAMGYESYADAANDPVIDEKLDRFYREINRAICLEYGVSESEQTKFALLSKAKFQNRAIADTVERNARSAARKLGENERILAPIRLIEKHGGDATVLRETEQAARRYLEYEQEKNA